MVSGTAGSRDSMSSGISVSHLRSFWFWHHPQVGSPKVVAEITSSRSGFIPHLHSRAKGEQSFLSGSFSNSSLPCPPAN